MHRSCFCNNCKDIKAHRTLKLKQTTCPKCHKTTDVEFVVGDIFKASTHTRKQVAFRVLKKLSKYTDAGMSSVYWVERTDKAKKAVVKVSKDKHLAALKREVEHLQQLQHSNIIQLVFGQGSNDPNEGILISHEDGERLCSIAIEYLDGGSLKDRLRKGKMSYNEASQIISQVANSIDYMHKKGYLHLDIKPANILLSKNGRVVLSDMGITRRKNDRVEGPLGTPLYRAPEQSVRGIPLDERADIYALGYMLYEMVLGHNPVLSKNPSDSGSHRSNPTTITRDAIRLKNEGRLTPPRQLDRKIPTSIENVILKATAYNQDKRYRSAGELAHALKHAVPKSTFSPTMIAIGIVVLIAILAGGFFAYQSLDDSGATGQTVASVVDNGENKKNGSAGISLTQNDTPTPVPGDIQPPEDVVVEPEETATPTETLAAGETRQPTSTMAATSTPKSTNTPTTTPTSAATNTSQATAVVATNTSVSVATSPLSSPATPTTSANPSSYGVIGLESPQGDMAGAIQTFRWKWSEGCALPQGLGFQIRIWPDGHDRYGAMDAKEVTLLKCSGSGYWSREINVSRAHGISSTGGSGRFKWDVALVTLDPYKPLVSSSQIWQINFGGE